MTSAVIPYIKSIFQDIPKPIGTFVACLPYSFRPGIGSSYARHKKEILYFNSLSTEQQKAFVLSKIQKLVSESMRV